MNSCSLFTRLVTLVALVVGLCLPAGAQCDVPMQPTSWAVACVQPAAPGALAVRVELSADTQRTFAVESLDPSPQVVTASLNRVRYEVSTDANFATVDAVFVVPVRPATDVLEAFGTRVFDSTSHADPSAVFAPRVNVRRPWTLYVRAVGGVLIQHGGSAISTVDFRASASMAVVPLGSAP